MPTVRYTCILASLCGVLLAAVPAGGAPAPAKPDAAGILNAPDQVYADAMRQSIGAPARADLGNQATVRLDGDLSVVPHDPAVQLLNVSDQPVPPGFLLLLMGGGMLDTGGKVRFVDAGFTDADAALAWNADDMLDSLRDTVERENTDRLRQGRQELEARRWIVPPRYDAEAHQLTWAALIVPKSAPRETDGEITFHAIAFGREGYIELTAITSVQQSDDVTRAAETFLRGIYFLPEKGYREVQTSDRRAPGGLAAAMGLDNLHKARGPAGFGSSDLIIPVTGAIVAVIGGFSLFIYIQRHLRRRARRV